MKRFDLVVIGGGPGGYAAAIRASQLGMRVAVAERNKPGGVCVDLGCIPSKAILASAGLFEDIKNAAAFGLHVKGAEADYGEVIRRSRKVSDRMSRGVAFLFKKNGIELFPASAVVTSPTTVRLGEDDLEAKNILIAVGTSARGLPTIVPDGVDVITSDEALKEETLPKSVTVLGAGAVGVEFAYIYRAFGAQVTLLEMMDQILPSADREVAEALAKALRKQGIRVIVSALAKGYNKERKTLTVAVDGKDEILQAEKLLAAVGRKTACAGLGLEDCGVKIEKGIIQVDDRMRTACPTIWAIGDVTGGMMLAHKASEEGIVAAEVMAGKNSRRPDPDFIPSCVYCRPEVASIGVTEEEAVRRGIKVKVARFPFSALGKAVATGHAEGFVKMIAEEGRGEVIGCHIFGRGAPEIIGEVSLGRSLGATWKEFGRAAHAHPTLTEAIRAAALMIGGEAIDI
ncbi:MAG: dihydrolipoyl dehydrogenase [Syntrophorhabdaceae bacterium]|nr:dihydrolipoyl dehydrogenase [Syntrophorhabdaceae bacterium]